MAATCLDAARSRVLGEHHIGPGLIPGPITAQRILDKPEREEDLGSGSKLQAVGVGPPVKVQASGVKQNFLLTAYKLHVMGFYRRILC